MRRETIAALAIAAAALVGCGDAVPTAAATIAEEAPQAPSTAPPEGAREIAQGPPGACEASSATLRILLCPGADASPATLRAALLEVDSPSAAARLFPHLEAAPDLAGLARLVILDRAAPPSTESTSPSSPMSPLDAVVSPVNDAVLAQVAAAMRLRFAQEASHADRLRALALLARVHNEALLQLGLVDGEPLGPFARLLAGRFLHCARELIQSYTQRRVAGLEALVPALELRLFAVSEALARSPHAGDDALLAVERQRARRILLRGSTRRRIQEATGKDPAAALGAWPSEIERLLDQDFVDLAIERALAEAPTHGSDAVLGTLLAALARRGLEDGRRLAIERFVAADAGDSPPPRQGATPLPETEAPAGPSAEAIAAAIVERLSANPSDRRPAIATALVDLRGRPDAAIAALARILPQREGSTEAGRSALVPELTWLTRVAEAALLPASIRLRQQVAAARLRPAAGGDAAETALRRRFALAAHEARAAADAKIAGEALATRNAAEAAALALSETAGDRSAPAPAPGSSAAPAR